MQQLSIDKQLRLVLNESFDKRRLFAIAFTIISVAIMVTGLYWPKTYESTVTLIWNRANVLEPLLDTAVTTRLKDQAAVASEVIYSNKVLEILIEKAELSKRKDGKVMSLRDIEILKSVLRSKIKLSNVGKNILKLTYQNQSAETAYIVISVVANLFLQETASAKQSDSREAFDFINKQVLDYEFKLEQINDSINAFKSSNVELQVDSSKELSTRVSKLREQLKVTSLELKEAEIQRESISEQLLIESKKNVRVAVVNSVNQDRLLAMEDQLLQLRLTFTENYPDIVQLKEQLKNLRIVIAEEEAENERLFNEDPDSFGAQNTIDTPLYTQLKQQLADLETQVKTLNARRTDRQRLLNKELARSSEVNSLASQLDELSRDYNVTKKVYEDLLTKRESARVSLNLELENAGSLFKIHEPPIVPLVPIGLRFLHFVLGSVVLGLLLPFVVVLVLLLLDPRIRHEENFNLDEDTESEFDFPVLGAVARYNKLEDIAYGRSITLQAALIMVLAISALSGIVLSRLSGYM